MMKSLKSVLLAFVVLTVASCGDDGTSPADDDGTDNGVSQLEGFWVLTRVDNQPAQPDSQYFLLENVSSFGAQGEFFILRTNSNCFDPSGKIALVKIGENRYQDTIGDSVTLTVQGNVLTVQYDVAAQGDQVQDYRLVIELSVQDLPLCKTTGISNRNSSGVIEHLLNALPD